MAQKQNKYARVVESMINNTRAAYHAAGKELSEEKLQEIVEGALDEVWPIFLNRELSEVCRIPLYMPQPDESEKPAGNDDDD